LVIVFLVVSMAGLQANSATPYDPPALEEGVPTTLDLGADFKPPRNGKREPLTLYGLYGVVLEKQKDTIPIYISRAPRNAIPNDTLQLGDIILAVNGKPLGQQGAKQFQTAQRHAPRAGGFFWFTRWRKGKVERVLVDLGTKMFDLTRTVTPGSTRDWRLGPLGANGWCFHRTTEHGASRDARQIVITVVDEDGPGPGHQRS
jgi:hypothetical protein